MLGWYIKTTEMDVKCRAWMRQGSVPKYKAVLCKNFIRKKLPSIPTNYYIKNSSKGNGLGEGSKLD
jgi:hypothetical protein